MRHYPDWIQSYLEYTSSHESSEQMRTWIAISVLAGVLERKVWFDFDYYKLFPNLYIFIIGPSGIVKKSTAMAIGVDLLREVSGVAILSERVTPGSLLKEMKGAGRFFDYHSKIVRQSPVYCYASELKAAFGGSVSMVSEFLTDFYDCQPHNSEKAWTSKNTAGKIQIYGPCLNILAGSTPAWLRRMIPPKDMEGGFASRVIFVVENQGSSTPVAWPKMDIETKAMKPKLIEDLREIHVLKGEFDVTPRARALFQNWYEQHEKVTIPRHSDFRFTGYMGRKGDAIRKLAMIRCVSQGHQLVVTDDHLIWATERLDALEKTMFETFNDGSEEDFLLHLSEFIRMSGELPVQKICEVFQGKMNPEKTQAYLKDLRAAGVIKERTADSGLYYSYLNEDGYSDSDPLTHRSSTQSAPASDQSS